MFIGWHRLVDWFGKNTDRYTEQIPMKALNTEPSNTLLKD